MFVDLIHLISLLHAIVDGGWGIFLGWGASSAIWVGPLIFLSATTSIQGCLNNPIFFN